MSRNILHTVVLTLAIASSFFLSKAISTELDLQVSALLFAVYFILKKILPQSYQNKTESFSSHSLLDSVFFTLIIMNIVHTTGGAASSLFFLTYFLVFALSLLLEPLQSMTTTFAMIIFFLLDLPQGFSSMDHLLPILSLPFITPFALFLGNEYRKVERQKRIISYLKDKEQDAEEEAHEEKKDTMFFLSLVIKQHIESIRDLAENFTGDHDLTEIKRTVYRMEKLIDKYEESIN